MSYKTSNNCLKFSLMAFFLLFLQISEAQPKKKNTKEVGIANFEQLDLLVQKNQKLLGNDLVVMVWTDTLVYKRELGDMDSKTVSPVGAASQWLTAALVMKFVDEGKLSLDDKISQYLPIFETYGKSYITLRHCLSHYTGIQTEGGGIFSKKKFGSLQEKVESFAKKEIRTNPGTDFSYSDIGLDIAGRVLEIVSKKKFDMLIKQQLFNPLAMRKTTFSVLDGSALNPSGGAQSTADEYMHFLQMLLNNGKYNGQQILSEESVKQLRTIHSKTEQIRYTPKTTIGFNYALGSWAIEEGNDGKATALASAGLTGAWPMVDWCRGYALLVITKSQLNELKKDPFMDLKSGVEDRLQSKCQ
jgi:CubicO group peptidase (beta-lactamase class C family)